MVVYRDSCGSEGEERGICFVAADKRPRDWGGM
jgi:hypothetical protein